MTMEINVNYIPNAKQELFHRCNAQEAVYGGAKGGGKSCALVMEALAYSLENAGAEMYIFRETYDDLEANIIREWKEKVPKGLYSYNESKHMATLINGTVIKFRYIRNFTDAEGYQGRSMDWIGVDELTKHEERSIQVLLSCLRSPKGFPPRFRGTCNPGGIGHLWVKERYILPTSYGDITYKDEITDNKIAFIPAKVYDNDVLMKNDPAYVKRLENLPEAKKKAFLDGDWDIYEGQFFPEYKREIHVIEPFVIPDHWDRYTVKDYGLDMLANYWIAVDTFGNGYVYKELYESNLIISEAARRIEEVNGNDTIKLKYAPPDLQGRRQDTGKSAFDIFREHGETLIQSSNNRVNGWKAMKEWLKVHEIRDMQTGEPMLTSKLKIFSNCHNLIRCLPQIQTSETDPNDAAKAPHEITHALDAIRYFCVMRVAPSDMRQEKRSSTLWMFDEQQQTTCDTYVNW
jgi:phage terminase large subunit